MNVCGVLLNLNCMLGEEKGMFPLLWSGHFLKLENTEESDKSATNETTYFSLVCGVLTILFSFITRIKVLVSAFVLSQMQEKVCSVQ